eukprot:TRINITY_DN4076_c0_g1_i8.p3 TRINITY_DN4076_c0_g1~~TRINITY_DN4076_c0_g1_i8.p3  ORF type:complete len:104 (+),score=16.36 TRINITY_DN4076_c0_g1_i8:835-1146(+)
MQCAIKDDKKKKEHGIKWIDSGDSNQPIATAIEDKFTEETPTKAVDHLKTAMKRTETNSSPTTEIRIINTNYLEEIEGQNYEVLPNAGATDMNLYNGNCLCET